MTSASILDIHRITSESSKEMPLSCTVYVSLYLRAGGLLLNELMNRSKLFPSNTTEDKRNRQRERESTYKDNTNTSHIYLNLAKKAREQPDLVNDGSYVLPGQRE